MRALIADNSRRARMGLRALLETAAVDIVGEAPNGQGAHAAITRLQPDVVLVDARMPGLDGVAVTRSITQRWPRVKVLALSLDPQDRARALDAGADAFVTKGGPIDELIATMRALDPNSESTLTRSRNS